MAATCHQLGMTAQARGRLDEADEWYRRSLLIKEELGDRPGLAMTYGQFGLMAEARQQPGEALAWMVKCVILFDQFSDPAARPGPQYLARLTGQLGMPALEQAWHQVTGEHLPQEVRDYVTSPHDPEPDVNHD
jgi:Tetratricopeptide repeat